MGNFTIEAFTLLGIGLCIIALRCYARWATVGWRGLKPDDYIMTFAAVCLHKHALLLFFC